MCDDAVLSVGLSPDSEFLATGCRSGALSVWNLSTGKRAMDFPRAHVEGITSVTFSKEGAQLLTSSFDTLAR